MGITSSKEESEAGRGSARNCAAPEGAVGSRASRAARSPPRRQPSTAVLSVLCCQSVCGCVRMYSTRACGSRRAAVVRVRQCALVCLRVVHSVAAAVHIIDLIYIFSK